MLTNTPSPQDSNVTERWFCNGKDLSQWLWSQFNPQALPVERIPLSLSADQVLANSLREKKSEEQESASVSSFIPIVSQTGEISGLLFPRCYISCFGIIKYIDKVSFFFVPSFNSTQVSTKNLHWGGQYPPHTFHIAPYCTQSGTCASPMQIATSL